MLWFCVVLGFGVFAAWGGCFCVDGWVEFGCLVLVACWFDALACGFVVWLFAVLFVTYVGAFIMFVVVDL